MAADGEAEDLLDSRGDILEVAVAVELGRRERRVRFLPSRRGDAWLDHHPDQLLVSEQSHAFFAEAAARLAELLGVEVARTPGTHLPYLDHPRELAQTVSGFLRRVSR